MADGRVEIALIGDAQFDSRGYSADVCRYTLMDAKTKLIVDWSVVQRRETVGNSPLMEKVGFDSSFQRVISNTDFSISELTTDQNKAILCLTKAKYPSLLHTTDKWHTLKNFKKNWEKVVKLKRNAPLRVFWEHLLVHIWVSISAANGNGNLALQLIQSAEYHLQGKHEFPGEFDLIDKCLHGVLDDDKAYLDPRKKREQIKVLHNMLTDPFFEKSVRLCSSANTTSALESFHAVAANIYMQKNRYYGKESTEHLMRLAVIHQNEHRMEILDWREGKSATQMPTRKKFSRAQGRIVETVRHPPPSGSFKKNVVAGVRHFYASQKDAAMKRRVFGSPEPSPKPEDVEEDSGSDSDKDSNTLSTEDSSDEETLSTVDDAKHVKKSESTPPSNVGNLERRFTRSRPTTQRKQMFIRRRELRGKIEELGQDADLYDFFDARTGDQILPI